MSSNMPQGALSSGIPQTIMYCLEDTFSFMTGRILYMVGLQAVGFSISTKLMLKMLLIKVHPTIVMATG